MSVLIESAAANLREITPFIKNWENKPQGQVIEEFASYSLEKEGKVDPYYFTLDQDGDLFSPSALSKVKKSIKTETRIGRLEAQAFDAISIWFRENSLGTIAWISPPADVYPVSKVIISSIEEENGRKRLFNRSILFKWNQRDCLKFAQDLSEMSQNRPLLTHLDQVRSTPLILDKDSKFWMYILEELIDDPELWQSIRLREDQLAKQEALEQAKSVLKGLFSIRPLVDKMNFVKERILPMLGNKPTSCPPASTTSTTFQIFSENSLSLGSVNFSGTDKYGSLEFDCPKCKRKNMRPHGKLMPNCQYLDCKADVRC